MSEARLISGCRDAIGLVEIDKKIYRLPACPTTQTA